ncbi:unnamed protein product [Mytilus edulis]|uniref:CABIT domain-containing protein n=1 Tax=Mytilus edulis TaxID=6550 RepID=A0A8S3T7H9_MYTED|nr:unnamed protein product [Mytilus edulis]
MEEDEHYGTERVIKIRKFKGGKRRLQTSNKIIDFKWSSHSYTLNHITNNFRLPCAVKCSVESCSLDWNLLHFDLSQPLLLHSHRSAKKVKAAVMKLDSEKGELQETGRYVVIPQDYNGWFTLLNDPKEKYLPDTTLKSVAQKDTDQVLVANSISCLCLTDSEQGEKQSVRKQISSGEILQIKRTDVAGSLTRRSPPSKYLVCTDEKDKDMYLPISQNGKFYKVNKLVTNDGLFQIKDVLDNRSHLPMNIRHVIGEVPLFSSEYSSYLKCDDIIEEETALASTMDDDLLLLELQIKTPMKFYIALNEAVMKQSDFYSDAFQNCETEGEDYIRGIKFSFTLSPESYSVCNSLRSLQDDGSMTESYYGTDSDLEEEDAQSEFSITWDPTNTKNSEKAEIKHVPKIFNSSINSPKTEDNVRQWNEEPETV